MATYCILNRQLKRKAKRTKINIRHKIKESIKFMDRLCGVVVSVADLKHRGPGFDSRALLGIFLRELGLGRDPLSLVIG
jgi:hypothetical protein